MFEQFDQLKARLDAARPLPAATMRSLHDDLLLRWTYHSNAIEGNTLSLLETKVVLVEGSVSAAFEPYWRVLG